MDRPKPLGRLGPGMWPWGHAAVGYLAYTLLRRRVGERPAGLAVIALAVGTQFPDLVDKPLGWTLGVLPGGRSLAHSLLTLAVVASVVLALARRYRRPAVGWAFVVGAVLHLAGDALYPALGGNVGDTTFLLWPLLPMPEPEIAQSFSAHAAVLEPGPTFGFELLLAVAALVAWHDDGHPGPGTLCRGAVRGFERVAAAVGAR
jgi:membrane-bound metal-dependent hydrolase YbcI (DUF457 family)